MKLQCLINAGLSLSQTGNPKNRGLWGAKLPIAPYFSVFSQCAVKVLEGWNYVMFDNLRKLFWKLLKREQVETLESRIEELSPSGHKSWYYFIDFGYGVTVRPELSSDPHSGTKNWRNFLSKNLPDVRGKRILDIGCNAGLYDLKMIEMGAAEVVGVDFDVQQPQFVREWFANKNDRDYSNIRYIAADATQFDFAELGHFDLALIFRVAYHFGEGIDHVMAQLSQTADTIVMQGNTPRLTNPKYAGRSHQHLAGVDGMQELLESYGFAISKIAAPPGHPTPLVVGSRVL